MAKIKLTKTQLREEQTRLTQLERYLPTLQLKKALLQLEVSTAQAEIEKFHEKFNNHSERIEKYAMLLTDKLASGLFKAVKIKEMKRGFENIAGIEVPYLEEVVFEEASYSLFDTPVWLDLAVVAVRKLIIARERIRIAREKKTLLEKELREVSIRVNLFEKRMIPRAQENIKKIKVFLGDQELAAVARAKVSKQKIIAREALA